MSRSRLQEPFLREVAATFRATKARIVRHMAAAIVEDEMRGLYHGPFVILDGGTALANERLMRIVDEGGDAFDRYLHELCFAHWPQSDE